MTVGTQSRLVAGLDIGTQGVRALVVAADGSVLARATQAIETSYPTGGAEQDPESWWRAACACLRTATAALGSARDNLAAISITSTSGTICLLDANGAPLGPALLYSDRRATAEATGLNNTAATLCARLGYRFDPSFGLPKLLWLSHNAPERLAAARHIAHSADVISGRLTGVYGISDWSHALKSGYDLLDPRWPEEVLDSLGELSIKLPTIVAPGTIIGDVTPAAADESGLPRGIKVVAGMTDGCTAQIAGGASEPGAWLSVLGTTLVFKGVSPQLLGDPLGRVYAHRHPEGYWLPGAASNSGGGALARRFPGADLATLDAQAAALSPTEVICYPLEGRGERFPFVAPTAEGFLIGAAEGSAEHYCAILEGIAYIERLAYETLADLGYPITGPIRTAGGGAKSPVWLQIRADVLGRPLIVPQEVEAAFGAAVIAAGAGIYPGLSAAGRAMCRSRVEIQPGAKYRQYEAGYTRFREALMKRGFLR